MKWFFLLKLNQLFQHKNIHYICLWFPCDCIIIYILYAVKWNYTRIKHTIRRKTKVIFIHLITQFICHCSNYWAYMLPCRYKRYNERNLNKKGWTSHTNFIMNLLFTKEENSGLFGLSDLHSPFQHPPVLPQH